MKSFFEPKSAVLIGASANKFRPGYQLFLNMRSSLGDNFYPVNPSLAEIEGKKCYKSVLDIPAALELAVIFIPAPGIPEVLEQCAQKGIKAAIIESAGFEEVGAEGHELADRCLQIACKNGMRLWGPNCMGSINAHNMNIFSFMSAKWKDNLRAGPVSIVVQSGMLSAGFLMHILGIKNFGLSKVCSVGNKMDVDEVDLMEYFVNDPETGVIGMYLESMNRGRKFFELAKSTTKPVVILKSGRSESGQAAAKSHTASLAQDDVVLDCAFRQAHIIRVYGMEELMEVVRCLSISPSNLTPKARVAILTFSGGAGVVCSDDAHDWGMEVAQLKPETLKRIKAVFPEWMAPSNPVDIYPAIEKNGPIKVFSESLAALLEDEGVDAVFMHVFAVPGAETLFKYEEFSALARKYHKPMIAWVIGHGETAKKVARDLEQHNIAVVDEISKGIRIIAALTMRR